jgi:hypothetical protein
MQSTTAQTGLGTPKAAIAAATRATASPAIPSALNSLLSHSEHHAGTVMKRWMASLAWS